MTEYKEYETTTKDNKTINSFKNCQFKAGFDDMTNESIQSIAKALQPNAEALKALSNAVSVDSFVKIEN